MKKKISNIFEGDFSIYSNSRSPNYQLQNHEKYERKNLPINLNHLKFIEQTNNARLLKALYKDPETNSPSLEFRSNLMYYYIFILIYIVIIAGFNILLYSAQDISGTHLSIHLTCLITIAIFGLLLLFFILHSEKVLVKSRNYFFLLSFSFTCYLIFADERVLNMLTNQPQSNNFQPFSIGLVCLIVVTRTVLFDDYLYTCLLGTSTIIIFLVTHLSLKGISINTNLSEIGIVSLFIILQIIECHRSDLRTKQIFWRRELEISDILEKSIRNDEIAMSRYNTESENIIEKCDTIALNLKKISRIVIYKDVKTMLKNSLGDLENIKKKIASGKIDKSKIELASGIDEDDKVFICENFMDVGSIRGSLYQGTFSEMTEKVPQFFFSAYGIQELEKVLSSIGKNWNFDIWFVYDSTGHSISMVGKYLLEKWSISENLRISEEIAVKYFQELENAYFSNPYHNACHASDVLHSLLYFVLNTSTIKYLTSIDLLSVILASLGHDVGHPGLTNRFLVNSHDPLAIQYNDNSVLENMHCSLTFTIMTKFDCNILQNLLPEDWGMLRKCVIEMILETDMSKHFEIFGKFRTRATVLGNLDLNIGEDRCCVLAMALKCADIGHSAKDTDLHVKWTNLVCEEFFAQGDLEKKKKLSVSMYCDRETTDVPKSQIGFIKNICLPLYEVWAKYLDSDGIYLNVVEKLKNNLLYWEKSVKKRKATVVAPKNSERNSGEIKRMQTGL